MNGFEIRLELLKMAKEMMDLQYKETSNTYWTTVETSAILWNTTIEDAVEKINTSKPVMYTPEDIAEKAKELYSFVSNNK